MRTRPLIAAIASIAVWLAGPAQAGTAAGWDFSQYATDGSLVKDLTLVPSNTLAANYSNTAAAPGAGPPAAAFGTLYFDGSFGSTSVDPNSLSPGFLPSAALGSLASNLGAPAAPGYVTFDSKVALKVAGQPLFNPLSMTAPQAVLAVFKADLGGAPPPSHHWEVSLGGRTFSGTSDLDVEFSTDGVSYSPMTTFNLTPADTAFSFPMVAAVTGTAYVRLGLDPSAGQPVIDNVAVILLPEPSMALQAPVALLALGLLHRFRLRRR